MVLLIVFTELVKLVKVFPTISSPLSGLEVSGLTWFRIYLVFPTGSELRTAPRKLFPGSGEFIRQLGCHLTLLGVPVKNGMSSAQNTCFFGSPIASISTL